MLAHDSIDCKSKAQNHVFWACRVIIRILVCWGFRHDIGYETMPRQHRSDDEDQKQKTISVKVFVIHEYKYDMQTYKATIIAIITAM